MTASSAASKLFLVAVITIVIASHALAVEQLQPYAATPDQVLVIYNADWKTMSEGTTANQDSREIAEYYAAMHTDPKTGKKPYLLGLGCRHRGKRHLNEWAIHEESTDNRNGITFRGKGSAPASLDWVRDSRKVEIHVSDPDADWKTLSITCRSETTGEEKIVTPLSTALQLSGIPPSVDGNPIYPPAAEGKGRSIRLDATRLFPGTVTVALILKNRSGKVIRDLSLRYYDARDFAFSTTGHDGIPDDKILEEDVLTPVRSFLEDPKNALPDGTLLKNHILYLVVVHGMPYSANGVFGIDHGATSNRNDHGSLASLEQRLQTVYYRWNSFKPPVISFHMDGGPDADKGVINHIITTGLRNQLTGKHWNPYIHPDTYSFLRRNSTQPTFVALPPLPERRKSLGNNFFAYGVSRIDGVNAKEAKQLIDNSIYASRHLRPEMDCRVRNTLKKTGLKRIDNLSERLHKAESLWGNQELELLGFGRASEYNDEGLPFLSRVPGDGQRNCAEEKPDWRTAGFYPGGMERHVKSENGLNYKSAAIWQHLAKGVTVSAAGAPAYSGGPHITNASFWDNRILLKYLFNGRDLGECFLLSTIYVNWSTSLIGDPLMRAHLRETTIDQTPPRPAGEPRVTFATEFGNATAHVEVALKDSFDNPEMALLKVTARDVHGVETTSISPLYSRRPRANVAGLKTGTPYTFIMELVDPYGNRTDLEPLRLTADNANYPRSFFKKLLPILEGKEPLIPADSP